MDKIIEWIFNLVLAVILPVELYLLIVGGIISLSFLVDVAYNLSKKRKIFDRDILYTLIRKFFLYTGAVLALYWMDEILLGEIINLVIPVENLLTKIGCITILFRDLGYINNIWGKLFGKSLSQNLLEFFDFYKKTKKDFGDMKDINKSDDKRNNKRR